MLIKKLGLVVLITVGVTILAAKSQLFAVLAFILVFLTIAIYLKYKQ